MLLGYAQLPLLIVLVFLLVTLVVRIRFKRKATTFHEYAIGNKNFSTSTLVAMVLAIAYSGSGFIRNIEKCHSYGLYWVMIAMLGIFDLWIIRLLAMRMGPFMQHLSMAETMGKIYGRYARLVTVFASISYALAIVASQIKAIAITFSLCYRGINPQLVAIAVALVVICYSCYGGIRSIAFTDLCQCITFISVIPLLAWFMFAKLNKPLTDIIPLLQTEGKFQFGQLCNTRFYLFDMLTLLLTFLMSYVRPDIIQRIYMASDTLQVKKVFKYGTIFSTGIKASIIIIALFIFLGSPNLSATDIWGYIVANVPSWFNGVLVISLLAMTMSPIDAILHSVSIMVSHDLPVSVGGPVRVTYIDKLGLARLAILVITLSAMLIAFHLNTLFDLFLLSLDVYIPIITAPFILAVLGLRSRDSTALSGMIAGTISIIAWNKWITPATGITGAFPSMMINMATMLGVHYLLLQPSATAYGQAGLPSEQVTRIRHAYLRQSFSNFIKGKYWLRFTPKQDTLLAVGIYMFATGFATYFVVVSKEAAAYCTFPQVILGVAFCLYGIIHKPLPIWLVSISWLIGLSFGLSFNLVWQWLHQQELLFTAVLSVLHWIVTLWVAPLSFSMPMVAASLSVAFYVLFWVRSAELMSSSFVIPLLCILIPGILAMLALINATLKMRLRQDRGNRLKQLHFVQQDHERKQLAYSLNIHPSIVNQFPKDLGSPLAKIVHEVLQAISFLDDRPIVEENATSIIHTFKEWVIFLNEKEQAKGYRSLMPAEITLRTLREKIEKDLNKNKERLFKFICSHTTDFTGAASRKLLCDVTQIIDLSKKVFARMNKSDLNQENDCFMRVTCQPTQLIYLKTSNIGGEALLYSSFPAIAFTISHTSTPLSAYPKVKAFYKESKYAEVVHASMQLQPSSIDLNRQDIERIVYAHYGHLEIMEASPDTLLIILPENILDIRKSMASSISMAGWVKEENDVTPEEQSNAMITLMRSHDTICRYADVIPDVIADTLLLLKDAFGLTRHASGELLYIRSVGIGQLVASWIPYAPKFIYAAMLYEAVKHANLSGTYVKANYNLNVWGIILQLLAVDDHEALKAALHYANNQLAQLSDKESFSILYIKTATRLYDLQNATGYKDKTLLKHIAQKALFTELHLVRTYLEPEIAARFQQVAAQALELSILA